MQYVLTILKNKSPVLITGCIVIQHLPFSHVMAAKKSL